MIKTALITGATSGLGLSYAEYYGSKGYDLIITGRRKEVIEENAKRIQNRYQVKAEVILGSLSEESGITALLTQIEGREIDVLVNNAGFGLKPCFSELSEADIEAMLYLQIGCVTKLMHAVLKGMLDRNRGTIINISSDGAFAVMPHNVLYSSTKLYLLNLTEGLHMELANTNIRVQAVCPGFIDSHFHEGAGMRVDKKKKGLFRFHQPDDVVARAMRDLEKGKVVSVPDRGAKLIRLFAKLLPRKLFYRVCTSFSESFPGKNSRKK